MKKIVSLALATAMILWTTACSGGSGTNAAPQPSVQTGKEQSEEKNPEGYEGPEYNLQLGHVGAEGSVEEVVANSFKELVEKNSSGKIQIEVFGNSQMGGLNDLVDAIRYDTLDFALFAAGNMESYNPKGTILGVPYLFSSYEHVEAFYGSDEWAAVRDELAEQTNALALGDFHTGFRDILSNVEIKCADDMKGLSIRIPEAPSFVKTFGALGCNTTALPASDVYQALQTGLVEATEAAPSYMRSMNYHEVAKYCIITNHMYTGNSIYVSKSKLESLDPAAQAIIKAAAKEAAEGSWSMVATQDEEAMKAFSDSGVELVSPDLDSFKNAMTDVWGELFIDSVEGGQNLIDAVLACDPAK
ncbi:MAG: TRAP transporter substrate-binding protein [Hungatella sp.]|nr:TRAP transporter substrate-binding protein [Hungatella sp.]